MERPSLFDIHYARCGQCDIILAAMGWPSMFMRPDTDASTTTGVSKIGCSTVFRATVMRKWGSSEGWSTSMDFSYPSKYASIATVLE